MSYEIYETKHGKRVNIGAQSFPLDPHITNRHGVLCEGRQLDLCLRGSYGGIMQGYAQACSEAAVPVYYAYDGVINELGDHHSVCPSIRSKPKDWNRYEPCNDCGVLLQLNEGLMQTAGHSSPDSTVLRCDHCATGHLAEAVE